MRSGDTHTAVANRSHAVQSCVLLLLLLLLVAAGRCSLQQQKTTDGTTAAVAHRQGSGQLLVTLLDGTLVSLDQDLGTVNWTLDLDKPLVSSSGLWYENSQHGGDLVSQSILPGADGSLYIFTDASGASQALEKLPATVAQLVEASPSATEDGALLLGTHRSSVYVVDAATGMLLRVLPPYEEGMQQSRLADEVVPAQMDLTNAVLLGREDFTIRSIDAVLGQEKWNVTYAQLGILTPARMLAAASRDTHQLDPAALGDADLLGITAGPLNTLHRHDPQSGVGLWTLQLDSPAVAVHLADGTSINLHGSETTAGNRSSVVVGSLHGSMYALPVPADWLQSTLPIAASPAAPLLIQDESYGYSHSGPSVPRLDQNQEQQFDQEHPAVTRNGDAIRRTGSSALPTEEAASVSDQNGLVNTVGVPKAGSPETAGAEGKHKSTARAGPQSTALMPVQPSVESGALWQCPVSLHSVVPSTAPQSFLPNLTEAGNEVEATSDAAQQPFWSGFWTLPLTVVAGGLMLMLVVMSLYIHKRWLQKPAGTDTCQEPLDAQSPVLPKNDKSASSTSIAAHSASEPRPSEPKVAVAEQTGSQSITSKPQAVTGKKAKRKAFSSLYGAPKPTPAAKSDVFLEHSNIASAAGNSKTQNGVAAEAAETGAHSEAGTAPVTLEGRSMKLRTTKANGAVVIGHMEVGPKVLGYGSQGTIVYEGSLHGRPVAVKRMLHHLYHIAKKEIDALILSDEHPCVVRCFAMEEDSEFVYLALERCKYSLADMLAVTPSLEAMFVDAQGFPTPWCMQVAQDIGHGLLAVHERGIVHRDLKPHNVLLTAQHRAKLSDMGHCKRLLDQQASFESPGAGGSSGWQAPEQLIARSGGDARQGYTTDVFSYGMLLFYCITAGKHPFGQHFERDFNILQGRFNLKAIEHAPEAEALVRAMLAAQPAKRPCLKGIMQQPFWWSPARRLAFLIHLSDRVETEDREVDQTLLQQLEAVSQRAVGGPDWASALDPEVVANLGKYRKYNTGSLRDLLRVIRNKHNHFREMPPALQQKLGPLPEGFLRYFTVRFPHLLMTTYWFAEQHCSSEPPLQAYFPHRDEQSPQWPDAEQQQLATAQPQSGHLLAHEHDQAGHLPTWGHSKSGHLPTQGRGQLGHLPISLQLQVGPSAEQDRQNRHQSPAATAQSVSDTISEAVPGTSSQPQPMSVSQLLHHTGISGTDGSANWHDLANLKDSKPPPSIHIPSQLLSESKRTASSRHWWPKQAVLSQQPLSNGSVQAAASGCEGMSAAAVNQAGASTPDQQPAAAWGMPKHAVQSADQAARWQIPDSAEVQEADSSAAWPSLQDAFLVPKQQQQQSQMWPQPLVQVQSLAGVQEHATSPVVKADDSQHLQDNLQCNLQSICDSRDAVQEPVSPDLLLPSVQSAETRSKSNSDGFTSFMSEAVESSDAGHLETSHVSSDTSLSNSSKVLSCQPVQGSDAAQGLGECFPQRPGQVLCDFYARTGFCKFGQGCKFDHPVQYAVKLNSVGLPLRINEPACPFYAKTGACKFGPSCKFNHPERPSVAVQPPLVPMQL